MNLQTGVSQWEFPASGDSSSNQASSSQEIVLHRPAPSHNAQNPESTTSPEDFDRYSLALDDIPLIVAAEQARAGDARPTDAPSMIFGTTRQPPSSTNRSSTPAHGHSQSLDGVPQIILSPSDGSAQNEFSRTDWG